MNQQIKEALKVLTDAMEEKFTLKKPYVVIDGVAPQFVEEVLEKVPDKYHVKSVWTQSQPIRNPSGIINGRPVQAGVQLQTFVFILLERIAFNGE